jgi:hypothetical protein
MNKELKERFFNKSLKTKSEKSVNNMKYIIGYAEKIEESYGKDICQFTPSECDSLIMSYPNRSVKVISVTISILKQYVDYCIEQTDMVSDRINWFDGMTMNLEHYLNINNAEMKYLTRQQLNDIQDKLLVNAVDAVILELLFIGIKGFQLEDLLNLKKQNVFFDKIVLDNGRVININERTYNLIQDAIDEEKYIVNNGMSENTGRLATANFYRESSYIIRPSGRSKPENFGLQGFRMRFISIKKFIGNPHLTIGSIFDSGMLEYLRDIKARKGELTINDYSDVNELFGLRKEDKHATKFKLEHLI